MQSSNFLPSSAVIASRLASRMICKRVAVVVLATLASAGIARAQQATDGAESDRQTIQMLLRRVEQLEARVSQLEAAKTPVAATAGPGETSGQTATTPAPPESEPEVKSTHGMAERMDTSNTLMRIRGFGDVTFHGDNQKGDTTSFTLGQLNLFVTSDISEKFKLLSEIVFKADTHNAVSVHIERLLLQYSHNDYLNIAVGRYHTAIGYYNTAYHHSTWLQTATGRPFVFQFDDDGGILPIHNVGVSASGLIPSGKLQLHYVAEVGNGRASRSPLDEAVQNVVDENNTKSVNFGIFATPDAIRGLQVGFSVYHDKLQPANAPRIGETILAAHAVMVRPNFEWLNEVLDIRHAPDGSARVFDTPAFYSQVSKRFGSYRPYFRYQYVNGSDSEPVFPDVGLRQGPSVGLRFDASESVALKLQYDRTLLRHLPSYNSLALQMGFTF
jgi:type II secretory pathway pseudopilin PulG